MSDYVYWKDILPTDKVIKLKRTWVVIRDNKRRSVTWQNREGHEVEKFMGELLSEQEETR